MSGYQVDHLDLSTSSDYGGCPGPKKSKTGVGTDGDWQYLLESPQHTYSGHSISKILKLEHVVKELTNSNPPNQVKPVGQVNPASPLFSYIPALFWSLHLLYEELKLDTSMYGEMQYIASLLSRLAVDLRLSSYLHHYWKGSKSLKSRPACALTAELGIYIFFCIWNSIFTKYQCLFFSEKYFLISAEMEQTCRDLF